MQNVVAIRPRRSLLGAGVAILVVTSLVLATAPAKSSGGAWTFVKVPGARGYEMGVDVARNGTVFVDEPSGLGTHSKLYRSKSDGQLERITFPSPYSRLPGGGDSDVVLSNDGRVYFLDLWGGSNSISVSKDNGTTWTTGTPFTTLPLSDRQWIALGKRNLQTDEDTVYAIYALLNPPDWAMFARSRDGGLTWDFHRPVPGLTSGSTGSTGNLVADGEFLAFSYEQGGKMYVATSHNEGNDWTTQEVNLFAARSDIPSTAVDGDNLYAAYIDAIDGSVYVVRSQNRGQDWELPKKIAEGGTTVFAWMAARAGKVAVAWYHSDSNETDPNAVQPNEWWTVKYAESLDGGTTWSTPTAITGKVKTGPICTNGLMCNANRELGDFLQVTIDNSGKSLVAYGDLVSDGSVGATVAKQP